MTFTKIKVKDIPLSPRRWRELRATAIGSMYRMNAVSADCYAFYTHTAGDKHMDGTISKGDDWSGGWDWSRSIVDTHAEYVLMLDGSGVYRIDN